jgi:hypothetical protein
MRLIAPRNGTMITLHFTGALLIADAIAAIAGSLSSRRNRFV